MFSPSSAFLEKLWNREDVRQNRIPLFGTDLYGNFLELCFNSMFLLCGEQVIRIYPLEAGDYGKVHGIFNRNVFRDAFSLTAATRWLKNLYRLNDVFCDIPYGLPSLERLLTKIGYRYIQDCDFRGIVKKRFSFKEV